MKTPIILLKHDFINETSGNEVLQETIIASRVTLYTVFREPVCHGYDTSYSKLVRLISMMLYACRSTTTLGWLSRFLYCLAGIYQTCTHDDAITNKPSITIFTQCILWILQLYAMNSQKLTVESKTNTGSLAVQSAHSSLSSDNATSCTMYPSLYGLTKVMLNKAAASQKLVAPVNSMLLFHHRLWYTLIWVCLSRMLIGCCWPYKCINS